jgi:hypothetical protein
MPEPKIPARATVAQLEGVLQISRTILYKHIRKAQLEPDSQRRYDTGALMDAILRHRADDKRLRGHGELKAHKLAIEGRILETRLGELEGRLVDKASTERDTFEAGRKLRDAILEIPALIAADLAAETDVHQIERRLLDDLRSALTRLSVEVEEAAEIEGLEEDTT